MKLLIIVLCLLSERFLVHASAHYRFQWYDTFSQSISRYLPKAEMWRNPWLQLFFKILPIVIGSALFLYIFSSIFFGFVGLILNLFIFYYCLGPKNPFYPTRQDSSKEITPDEVGGYLSDVNSQLFAVIFWYIFTGPVGIIFYRLVTLSKSHQVASQQATQLANILEWLPAKMTSLLYLLVGNFQAGIRMFAQLFLTPPDENQLMLSACGLQAVDYTQNDPMLLSQAETLVEHAVIALLVIIAVLTMLLWI